jgi:hypothetical protein
LLSQLRDEAGPKVLVGRAAKLRDRVEQHVGHLFGERGRLQAVQDSCDLLPDDRVEIRLNRRHRRPV